MTNKIVHTWNNCNAKLMHVWYPLGQTLSIQIKTTYPLGRKGDIYGCVVGTRIWMGYVGIRRCATRYTAPSTTLCWNIMNVHDGHCGSSVVGIRGTVDDCTDDICNMIECLFTEAMTIGIICTRAYRNSSSWRRLIRIRIEGWRFVWPRCGPRFNGQWLKDEYPDPR